jgi:MoaA/NifB/PqqE/SkfB family radical SAM enzyme
MPGERPFRDPTDRSETGAPGRRRRSLAGPGPIARGFAALVARLYLRRPDLAEAVAIRYRGLRAVLAGIANEVAYRLGWSRAPALISANLEVTNRCNLRCTFCPTADGRMERAKGFMDPALFERTLDGAGRLEFALLFQWGEPLLHPRFFDLASSARRRGIRTLVTTNGTLLNETRIAGLLRAGLDRVTVSVDGDARTHEAVRGVPLSETRDAVERLVRARDAGGHATAVDVSMVVAPETEEGTRAFLAAFTGVADRVQTIPLLTRGTRRTRCREPWRGGLVVLQDGRVTVCCVDHDGVLAVGDARKETLREIWRGAKMRALRRAHATGDLPALCAGCTEYPTDAAAPRFSGPARAGAPPPEEAPPPVAPAPSAPPRVREEALS